MSLTAWLWILLVLEVLLFDYWLYKHRKPSLSQWLWKVYKRAPWVKWAVLAGIVAVALHLVFMVWSGPTQPVPEQAVPY